VSAIVVGCRLPLLFAGFDMDMSEDSTATTAMMETSTTDGPPPVGATITAGNSDNESESDSHHRGDRLPRAELLPLIIK
jgi:hypothetical protein